MSMVSNVLITSTSKCPFLSRLPTSFIRNYGTQLVAQYADKCPFASSQLRRGLSTLVQMNPPQPKFDSNNNPNNLMNADQLKNIRPCQYQPKRDQHTHTKTTSSLNSSSFDETSEESYNQTSHDKQDFALVRHANHEFQDQQLLDSNALPSSFDYDTFFHGKIAEKKMEHSYRVFKKLARLAGEFPLAHEYSGGVRSFESEDNPAKITVWCSNDYLGMSRNPLVKRAVIEALDKYGAGSGGTRNIAGNSILHEKLEALLAQLHGKERALLFTSCYVANDTTLFTLGRMLPGCHLFSDAGNHASMIQGIRNSQVPKHVFKHNDPIDLERHLATLDIATPKIVAFETVHSMSGAICPLKTMCDVSHKYGALTFVDEVHAVGLYGKRGAGIGERNKCLPYMDMITGTLGKAFGSIGGYLAGPANLIDSVRSYGSGFIFTTSLPPTVLAAALTSVKILMSEEGIALREKHQENVKYLRNSLMREGIPVIHTPSHIIPISIGDPMVAAQICDLLLSRYGHYIQSINYPTVPRGSERLRLAPTPFHTRTAMDALRRDLVSVWNELGLPFKTPTCQFNCEYCLMPFKFEMYTARHDFMPCVDIDCPKLQQIHGNAVSKETIENKFVPKSAINKDTCNNHDHANHPTLGA